MPLCVPRLFPVPRTVGSMARRKFGSIDQRASGRYRARYRNPQAPEQWVNAPQTYASKDDAAGWLRGEEKLIEFGEWTHPDERNRKAETDSMTVRQLCEKWLTESPRITKESTRQSHRRKLQARVYGYPLADMPVTAVARRDVKDWWRSIDGAKFTVNGKEEKQTTPTTNSSAYKRLHTAFDYALHELEIITVNPVNVSGAAVGPKTGVRDRPLISLEEARALVEHAPARLKAPVALLLWSGLRLGELLELRRGDLDGLDGDGAVTVRVRRNAQRVTDEKTKKQIMIVLDTPKTDAGNRDIVLPSSVAVLLRQHAAEHMTDGADALVVTTSTGAQMMDTNFRNRWKTFATAAGRPDVTPHDCRRFYGTVLVDKGRVSLEEARRLMGHETVEQLMEYQRALQGYEQRAADALDALADGSDK